MRNCDNLAPVHRFPACAQSTPRLVISFVFSAIWICHFGRPFALGDSKKISFGPPLWSKRVGPTMLALELRPFWRAKQVSGDNAL